jgi:hypothetical protein
VLYHYIMSSPHSLSNAEHLVNRCSIASDSVLMTTDDFEEFHLLGNGLCTPLKVDFQRINCVIYPKMELFKIINHITLHNHHCENLKCYANDFVSEVC